MKKLLFTIASACLTIGSFAQTANAVFFSNEGQKMYVILNGVKYNDQPQTNVRIDGLNAATYKAKIVFEHDSMGFAEEDILLKHYHETTFSVELGSKTATGKKLSTWGKNISRDLNMPSSDRDKPTHKIKLQSEIRLNNPAANTYSATPTEAAATTEARPQTQAQTNTQATTTTNVNTTPTGSRVSANMNVSGVSMNVSVNESMTYSETQTTTTGTQYGTTTSQTSHYNMPGYNGPVGCSWPMNDGDFGSAKSSISSKSFEDSKLTLAKQVFGSNCMTSGQVKEIMQLFDFEDTKLEFAKYAYGYTFDIGNYYKVNDAFEFESSIDELNQYIQSKR